MSRGLGLTATLVALASLSSHSTGANTPTSDGDFGKDDGRKFEPGNRAQYLRGGWFGLPIPDYQSSREPLPAYDGKTRTEGAAKGQKRLTRAQRKAGKGRDKS